MKSKEGILSLIFESDFWRLWPNYHHYSLYLDAGVFLCALILGLSGLGGGSLPRACPPSTTTPIFRENSISWACCQNSLMISVTIAAIIIYTSRSLALSSSSSKANPCCLRWS